MEDKIIVRKSKPNYFSIATGLVMFYFSYNYFSKGATIMAVIALLVGVIGVVHNLLLVTTPLIIQNNDSLIIKPKIPFERKVILIEEIKEVKATAESQLIIIMENKTKIKLDLTGFKKKEIEAAKAYLISIK